MEIDILSKITYLSLVTCTLFVLIWCVYQNITYLQNRRSSIFQSTWDMRAYYIAFNVLLAIILLILMITIYFHHIFYHHLTSGLLIITASTMILHESLRYKKNHQIIDSFINKIAKTNVQEAFLYTELESVNAKLKQQRDKLYQVYRNLNQSQSLLIHTEKMATLGQLIAGISHEVNTPLGAIQASAVNFSEQLKNNITDAIQTLINMDNDSFNRLSELLSTSMSNNTCLSMKDERKNRRNAEIALDEMGIENFEELADMLSDMHLTENLSAVHSLLKGEYGEKAIEALYSIVMLSQNIRVARMALGRAKKVMFSLKEFSHSNINGTIEPVDLVQSIQTILIIYTNQMKHATTLKTNFDEVNKVLIQGLPDELAQVWTNIIHNALQAMQYKGVLKIEVSEDDENAYVKITDNGPGIDDAINDKILLAFFTTKAPGEGSGLGLHIVKTIVEKKHQGKISFTSSPTGTTFTVQLPKTISSPELQ